MIAFWNIRHVISLKYSDVSEVLTTSTTRAIIRLFTLMI
jgi:hypothetical protein